MTVGANAPSTAVPRNTEQVRNVIHRMQNSGRLSRDALFNLHEFAYDSKFVHQITTFPNLSVVMYKSDIVDMFRTTLGEGLPTQ